MEGWPLLLVVASALLHALWNLAARKVSGDMGVLWLGLALASICGAPAAALTLGPGAAAALPYVLATGAIHAVYFVLLAKAYETGELSEVYPLARGAGVAGTALAARLLLSETVGLVAAAGVAAVCLGTLLIGRGRDGRGLARALAIGAAIAGYSIVDKLAMAAVHPMLHVFGIFAVTSALLAPYVWLRRRGALRRAWAERKGESLLIGLAAMTTYLMVLFAFRLGPASLVVAVREVSVVFGAVLGVVLLKESMPPRKGLGIAAVMAGILLIRLG